MSDLSKLILNVLGNQAVETFEIAREFHYKYLAYRRISHVPSLEVLRAILYDSGALTLNRVGAWKLDSGLSSYNATFDTDIRAVLIEKLRMKRSDALDASAEVYSIDIASGSGFMIYEATLPCVSWLGVALSREYSLEGTLCNCLKPEYQWDPQHTRPALLSPSFQTFLNQLDFLSCLMAACSPETALAPSLSIANTIFDNVEHLTSQPYATVYASDIMKLGSMTDKVTNTLIHYLRDDQPRSEFFLEHLMISEIIDELISRQWFSNGMFFEYGALKEEILDAQRLLHLLLQLDRTEFDCNVEQLADDLAYIASAVEAKIHSSKDVIDVDVLKRCSNLLRRLNQNVERSGTVVESEPELAGRLLGVSNEIIRWILFMAQAAVGEYSYDDLDTALATLEVWMQHPFAILKRSDLNYFQKWRELDDPMTAWGLVVQYLENGIRETMVLRASTVAQFETNSSSAYVNWLKNRLILARARYYSDKVINDIAAHRDTVEYVWLILNSFAAWVYGGESSKSTLAEIDGNVDSIAEWLRSGEWSNEFLAHDRLSTLLTSYQRSSLKDYQRNPTGFVDQYLDFGNARFGVRGRVDHYVF